ncbi:unnamed protein product [Adineta ricciae]|uniref:Uncharacterized protein n=1 Tax=Adineta ricciae TaxID=249248 RepID=A0A815ZIB1_ADIRI|nr:unnamed protein product [Adineta ricciae]CAF1585156.1 unnamed protein product [Adineta ricciae]
MTTTISNLHSSTVNESQNQSRKADRSLLRMTLVQVCLLRSLTVPQATQRLYTVFADSSYAQLQATIDMFIYNIGLLLTYLASAIQFLYFYINWRKPFRQALFDRIKSIFNIIETYVANDSTDFLM